MPPAQLIATLRSEVDSDLPVYDVKSLDEHLTATLTPQRLLAHLITGFGVLALLLAGIGLYGLLAHTVTERTPEIGLRMALGAHKPDVVRMFVTRGMKLALAGVCIGLVAAGGLTQLMRRLKAETTGTWARSEAFPKPPGTIQAVLLISVRSPESHRPSS